MLLERPSYEFDEQPGTRIRNGLTIRELALLLADAVDGALSAGRFPLVLGGDCSVLLGCLVGARRAGRCGLVHVDGHIDFFYPGNYDTASRLGSVAGMDLALATGRGEALLTGWPGVGTPLVLDADAIQVGDRETESEEPATGTLEPSIALLTVQEILHEIAAVVAADQPILVHRYLELHGERLTERLAGQLQILARLEQALQRALLDRSRQTATAGSLCSRDVKEAAPVVPSRSSKVSRWLGANLLATALP